MVLAVAVLTVLATPAPASAAMDEPQGTSTTTACAQPVVSREYTTESMTYRVTVDLHGCDWWDGSPLSPVAVLGRDDGKTEDFPFSPVACTGVVGNEEDPHARPDVVDCEAMVTLEHENVEVAHYRGAVSYVWKDGGHTGGFETTCVSSGATASCDSKTS